MFRTLDVLINHIIISTLWKQSRLQLSDLPVVDWSACNNNVAHHHEENDHYSHKHSSRSNGATRNEKWNREISTRWYAHKTSTHHIFAVPDLVPWTPPNCDSEVGDGLTLVSIVLKDLMELLDSEAITALLRPEQVFDFRKEFIFAPEDVFIFYFTNNVASCEKRSYLELNGGHLLQCWQCVAKLTVQTKWYPRGRGIEIIS